MFLYSYWGVTNLFSLFFNGQREWLTYMYSTKCMLYHNSKIAFIYVFAHFKCFNGSLPVWNILVAPRLAKPKEDIEKVAFKGDDVSFECAAKGYPLEVEWKVKKKNEETFEACISKFCRMILLLFRAPKKVTFSLINHQLPLFNNNLPKGKRMWWNNPLKKYSIAF